MIDYRVVIPVNQQRRVFGLVRTLQSNEAAVFLVTAQKSSVPASANIPDALQNRDSLINILNLIIIIFADPQDGRVK